MTLILGICSNESVVMACDSQTSIGDNKHLDATKLHEMDFGNVPLLVGGAGAVVQTARYLEILEDVCAKSLIDQPPRSAKDIGKVLSEAMKLFRRELQDIYDCSSQSDLNDAILRNSAEFSIMVGCRFGKIPSLITTNVFDPVYFISPSKFMAKGSGAILANHVVRDYAAPHFEKMGIKRATSVAIATVDKIKDADIFCGGKTRVGIIVSSKRESGSRRKMLSDELVSGYREIVRTAEKKAYASRHAALKIGFEERESLIAEAFSESKGYLLD